MRELVGERAGTGRRECVLNLILSCHLLSNVRQAMYAGTKASMFTVPITACHTNLATTQPLSLGRGRGRGRVRRRDRDISHLHLHNAARSPISLQCSNVFFCSHKGKWHGNKSTQMQCEQHQGGNRSGRQVARQLKYVQNSQGQGSRRHAIIHHNVAGTGETLRRCSPRRAAAAASQALSVFQRPPSTAKGVTARQAATQALMVVFIHIHIMSLFLSCLPPDIYFLLGGGGVGKAV